MSMCRARQSVGLIGAQLSVFVEERHIRLDLD